MYLVPGLEVFEAPIKRLARLYNIPVHFVPHWDVARHLRNGLLRFHAIGAEKLRLQRTKDVERALKNRTGISWFAYGERATDSIARRLYTRECDGVQQDWHRLWPVWDWKDREIYSYLKGRDIPIAKQIGRGTGSGITLMPVELAQLKKDHPRDYAKLREVFPFADLQVARLERGDFDALPGFLVRASPSGHPPKRAVQSKKDHRARQEEAQKEPEEGGASRAGDLEQGHR